MQVKKSQLEVFFKTLRGTDGVLSLADARIRDAFMKPLGVHLDSMIADRRKIYDAYVKTKEDGSPDIEGNTYHFSPEDVEAINKEIMALMEEIVEVEFVWGVTGAKLKEIMEKSQYKPVYGEIELIDEIIKALE